MYMDRIMADIAPAMSGATSGPLSLGAAAGYAKTAVVVIIAVIIGLMAARVLARLARSIVRRARIDKAFATLGWSKQLADIGIDVAPSAVVAWLVKWFIIIATFSFVVNYLGAQQLATFLNDVLSYLPNVVIAVVVLVIGSLVANTVRTAVERVLEKADGVTNAVLLAKVPYYAIMTITVLAALNHLGIGGKMVEIFFTGIVVAFSLALGLAFGLGGKEHAARLLDRLGKK